MSYTLFKVIFEEKYFESEFSNPKVTIWEITNNCFSFTIFFIEIRTLKINYKGNRYYFWYIYYLFNTFWIINTVKAFVVTHFYRIHHKIEEIFVIDVLKLS